MKQLLSVIAGMAFAASAYAGPIWEVTDATTTNCGPHGLWTQNSSSGCDNYYSFQAGSTLTQNDDGTAVLSATAFNGTTTAVIDLTFSAFTDDHTSIQNLKGTQHGDESAWVFYQQVAGTIDIGGIITNLVDTNLANANVGQTAFQLGAGANDKNSAFGGSAWIQGPNLGTHHWDLNMNLARVPAPGALGLLGMGLIGVGLTRRKRAA